ncbi:aspartyl/glutamyl-tRNA(Asn/Gln) amidotransferase, A subunit [Pneumocystis jirovecii RU7]|uniref:Glutamyl-tRNA(Gln) amidotransferase subunit A, mitochondrial n=1 Tax=Pneumocystis jirovecii (strain RU7) TaxID=1408657 RepID=A0A0W4ZU06_PNEJ7|nr:aspartyl/glutamyl-tRNA(Asn/Gln) amidotransferase, A subunit [Pneumocystis jirovecii RU7]KTW31851.1 aspartyl/glutamyl-tRNA(Asn/Gln) amidotransferase, A subunit [Pneumocystis jirovecii RU7]
MELVKEAKFHLDRINKLNKYLNVFINLADKDSILKKIDDSFKRNLLSPLDGKIIAIKDNICTKDMPTTCSSYILKYYISPYEATIVTRLKNAGAIIPGKTNMDEFAIGSTTTNTIFGPTLNPINLKNSFSAGGSSGGSAAAVSAEMCYAAIGTDTGGSVRLPASYCNCVGFKPSYGLISRWGVIAYSNSLDTVGIISKTVQRVRETFNILNVYDPKDPTSLSNKERSKLKKFRNKKLTIGIPLDFNINLISLSAKRIWKEAIEYLKFKGFNIVPVTLPNIKYSPIVYNIITSVEASSNLAKYNGFIYGHSANINDNEDLFQKTRDEGFGDAVKQKILLGVYFSAYTNYFEKAQKIRRLIKNDFDNVFCIPNKSSNTIKENKVHMLIIPTTSSPAPLIENVNLEISMLDIYLIDFFTISANLSGIPAITIPFPSNENEMPIGIQLMAPYGYDNSLLDIAEIFEQRSLQK